MAKSANKESVELRDNGADWAGVLELIVGEIHAAESDQQSLSQKQGQLWQRVEKTFGVNAQGAKKFSTMMKKPVDKRRDEFRTFFMLAKTAGWMDWLNDLVDQAEGAPTQKAPKPVPDLDLPPVPEGDTDLAGETIQ